MDCSTLQERSILSLYFVKMILYLAISNFSNSVASCTYMSKHCVVYMLHTIDVNVP